MFFKEIGKNFVSIFCLWMYQIYETFWIKNFNSNLPLLNVLQTKTTTAWSWDYNNRWKISVALVSQWGSKINISLSLKTFVCTSARKFVLKQSWNAKSMSVKMSQFRHTCYPLSSHIVMMIPILHYNECFKTMQQVGFVVKFNNFRRSEK